jgi:protein subunit release factor A
MRVDETSALIHPLGPPAQDPAMPLLIEMRAAEGGDDAKLLVIEQRNVYQRWGAARGL